MTEQRNPRGQGRPRRDAGGPRIQPSRQVAFDVIRAVTHDDAYANLLLPARIADARLSTADAAFATELAYGTLRRSGYYDRVIELAAGRGLRHIDPEVLDVLRLGAHQLLGMRVAPHAAVDECVSLTHQVASRGASGFVNGVLRTITRTDPEIWLDRALDGLAGDARLAVEFAHPEWVVRALRDALTADGRAEELEELLAADNDAPRVSLVALPGLAEVAELDGDAASVSPLAATLASGDPADVTAVAEGRARVQDEGSQLAALALSRARPVAAGERWLDLCAGPGGKAALLAAEAAAGGATLLANELIPARARLVRSALAAVRPTPEVVVGDGVRFAGEPAAFDRILLDAPCTGLGALRRRPEARWRKQPADVAELTRLQSALLDAALTALKPGGLLAYVTCSPHLAETRGVVAEVLRRHPAAALLDTAEVVQSVAVRELDLPASSSVQLWPHRHGTDAMFIQLITVGAPDRVEP